MSSFRVTAERAFALTSATLDSTAALAQPGDAVSITPQNAALYPGLAALLEDRGLELRQTGPRSYRIARTA